MHTQQDLRNTTLESYNVIEASKQLTRDPISIFKRIKDEAKDKVKKEELKGLLEKLREKLPSGFKIGAAVSAGDCFFDAVAQGLNELKDKGLVTDSKGFNVKSLREDCASYAKQHSNQDSWVYEAIVKDAEVGSYFVAGKNVVHGGVIEDPLTGKNVTGESDTFNKYLEDIKNVAIENGPIPIWGRLDIEGKMICKKYEVKIEAIELTEGFTGNTRVIKSEQGESNNVIRIVNCRQHFVPLLNNIKEDIEESVPVSKEEVCGIALCFKKDVQNSDLRGKNTEMSEEAVAKKQ